MVESAGLLVAGASQAGIQLACSLREFGYTKPITVVGAEQHPPYQRPPLSKALLSGETTADALELRSALFYAEHHIDLVLGERIVDINRVSQGAGLARTLSGRLFAFDRLALAVGARPRRLDVPGAELDGVLYLRDADDALALHGELSRARNILVIGGGFIGLEVAASARKLGHQVTVAVPGERLLGRAVGEVTSSFFLDAHSRRGNEVHLGVRPIRLLADTSGRVRAAELDDGVTVDTDLVVVGIGSVPRTELAEHLGLAVDDGILVDAHGLTSDGVTIAAGDCVACPPPVDLPDGPGRMRFESVNTAIEQAKTAAATIVGTPTPYRAIPWFWSDQFDLKLQVVGLSSGYDRYVVRGIPEEEKFAVLYYRGDHLIAGEFINRPADFLAAKAALSAGRSIPSKHVADAAVPLKKLVLA